MKQLTEPQAWRKIARRIAAGQWRKAGLCYEVDGLLDARAINLDIAERMTHRASAHAEVSAERHRFSMLGGFFAFPQGAEPEARCMAALWMALEAEEELAGRPASEHGET